MKWTTSFTVAVASLGSIASALPTQLNNPEYLMQGNETGNELAARGGDTYCTPWGSNRVAPLNAVGGGGGGAFCGAKGPGSILPKTLTTYSNGNNIAGIEVTYTDGSLDRFGKGFNTKNSGSITFGPGELVTSAWLAGNGIGTRLGKIHIVTNKQTVDLGTSNAPNTYQSDVGGGLFLGIAGYSGDEIDSAVLLFLKPKVTGIDIGNMQLDPDQLASKPNAQVAFADQVHYFNNGKSGNQTFLFTNSHAITTSTTISQSTTGTFQQAIAFSVEFSIPEIVKLSVSNTITWSVAHTTGSETTNSETNTQTYSQGGTLAPQTGVDCSAIIYKGSGTFSYTSTVTLKLDDGSTVSYSEPGQLQTQQYTEAKVNCNPTNVDVVPSGYSKGKTQ